MRSTVYDGSGNGNGFLDPGETVNLTASLKNIGGVNFANLNSTLICSSPYVSISDNSGVYGAIMIDSIKENTGDRFTVSANGSTPYNTEVTFLLRVQEGSFIDTLFFDLIIGLSAPTDTGLYFAYYAGSPFPQAPTYSWIRIDSTQTTYPGVSLDLADNEVVQIALPFNFQYYGVDYDTISISSDGWVALGFETTLDNSNTAIPSADGPSAMIAGIWDDLDPGNAGAASDIYYYYEPNNHIFIVEYFEVEHWPSGQPVSFEIILYDPLYYPTPTNDGEIIVQYKNGLPQNDVTLGIENFSETIGIQYFLNGTYDPLAGPVTNDFAIKYTTYPPGGVIPVQEENMKSTKPHIRMPSVIIGDIPLIINYNLSVIRNIDLGVYNINGSKIISKKLYPTDLTGKTSIDLSGLASGVYFIRANSDPGFLTFKLIIIK